MTLTRVLLTSSRPSLDLPAATELRARRASKDHLDRKGQRENPARMALKVLQVRLGLQDP